MRQSCLMSLGLSKAEQGKVVFERERESVSERGYFLLVVGGRSSGTIPLAMLGP